jgi:hypothetical protein
MRLNLLCLSASSLIVGLGYGTPISVALGLLAAAIVFALAFQAPHREPTPRPIRRVPTTYERQSRSKWIPGVTIRIPFIPFLSIGLWRWRGRK